MEKERFMLDDLKIPAEWIHEAKVGLGKVCSLFFIILQRPYHPVNERFVAKA